MPDNSHTITEAAFIVVPTANNIIITLISDFCTDL